MKKYLFCFMLMIASYGVFAQQKVAVLKVLQQQQTEWNKGNIEGFMQGYWHSDSLLFVSKAAPKHGWQITFDNYKKGYPDKAAMGTLSFDILEVKMLDANNAFVLGAWHLKREKDAPGGYFTLLFRKIKGEWKIVVDHTS